MIMIKITVKMVRTILVMYSGFDINQDNKKVQNKRERERERKILRRG